MLNLIKKSVLIVNCCKIKKIITKSQNIMDIYEISIPFDADAKYEAKIVGGNLILKIGHPLLSIKLHKNSLPVGVTITPNDISTTFPIPTFQPTSNIQYVQPVPSVQSVPFVPISTLNPMVTSAQSVPSVPSGPSGPSVQSVQSVQSTPSRVYSSVNTSTPSGLLPVIPIDNTEPEISVTSRTIPTFKVQSPVEYRQKILIEFIPGHSIRDSNIYTPWGNFKIVQQVKLSNGHNGAIGEFIGQRQNLELLIVDKQRLHSYGINSISHYSN